MMMRMPKIPILTLLIASCIYLSRRCLKGTLLLSKTLQVRFPRLLSKCLFGRPFACRSQFSAKTVCGPQIPFGLFWPPYQAPVCPKFAKIKKKTIFSLVLCQKVKNHHSPTFAFGTKLKPEKKPSLNLSLS